LHIAALIGLCPLAACGIKSLIFWWSIHQVMVNTHRQPQATVRAIVAC
jgi:hypothetical protein